MPSIAKFNVRTVQQLAPSLGASTRDGYSVLRLGPDEYLIVGDAPSLPVADSVVDVSHRSTGIRISGPRAAWCVNAFCALDLDRMPVDGCTRTLFGKAEIILWRRGEQEFHIETALSFTPYVWVCLEEARREFLSPAAVC
jgi:heterotetrameric sarcosine oxidase gamma subunit